MLGELGLPQLPPAATAAPLPATMTRRIEEAELSEAATAHRVLGLPQLSFVHSTATYVHTLMSNTLYLIVKLIELLATPLGTFWEARQSSPGQAGGA